jgi:hypothetical protein
MSEEGDDPNPKSTSIYIKRNKCPEIQKIEFSEPSPYTIKTPPAENTQTTGLKHLASMQLGVTTVNVIANDPENDLILYKFSLKGPSTFNSWETRKDWSDSSDWIWFFSTKYIGTYSIKVEVKDTNEHCKKCNAYQVEDYILLEEDEAEDIDQ